MTADNPKLTVYGMSYSSYVRSVLLCCEEKGIPYQTKEAQPYSKQVLKMNPFGRIPVIQHGTTTVFETSAICIYVDSISAENPLSPQQTINLITMHEWISALNSYYDQAIIRDYVLGHAFPSGKDGSIDDQQISRGEKRINRCLPVLNNRLSNSSYLAGENLSIADCILIPMLDYLDKSPGGKKLIEGNYSVEAYLANIRERPSCKRILFS